MLRPSHSVTTSLSARIGAALTAVLIAFGLCELAARAVFPAPPNPARQPQVAYLYDQETRYVPLPGQRAWVDDGLVTINDQGFRGDSVAIPKPQGRSRVIFVGDSVTFGRGVHDAETYPSQFERIVAANSPHVMVDVVNGGVDGYNTRQAVGRVKQLLDFDPDLVIVGFYSNDVPDALGDDRSGTRISGSAHEGRVMYINPVLPTFWGAQLRKSRALHVSGRALKQFTGFGEGATSRFTLEMDVLNGRSSPEQEQAWESIRLALESLSALGRDHGFAIALVILPCREQVLGQFPDARYQARVRNLAEPLGFRVIDPLARLVDAAKTYGDLFIPYDRNHPTATGYRIIAQAIADDLGHLLVTD